MGRRTELKRIGLTGLVMLVLGLSLIFLPSSGRVDAEWETAEFEEAIEIAREPDHLSGRPPLNMEPLHIVISSKSDQPINGAAITMSWAYEGHKSPEGGFSFTKIDQGTWETTIEGYPGGYVINYQIVAYDEKNHPLTSPLYSYTVQQNGSFTGNDFDTNIEISWGPEDPKQGEPVTVNISSRDPSVSISMANLFFDLSLPDEDAREGTINFFPINSTHLTAVITAYPPDSKLSFYIEAFDSFYNSIRSSNYRYEYEPLPDLEPVYTGVLWIQLWDKANGIPPNNAVVTFSNDTWMFRTTTTAGVAASNVSVDQGNYTIMIEYEGKTYTYMVSVPVWLEEGGTSFTFKYDINEKTYQVPFEEEDRPGVSEIVGAVLLIILVIGGFIGAGKVRGIREEINERKKRTRRTSEAAAGIPWYEGLLTNEEHKSMVVRGAAFLLLSLLGLFWAPFYPWWMVLMLALFLTAVAVKYPYVSLLIMAVLVSAAAGYQSREFGWVFLLFSLIVLIGGFFEWKFAYLAYLTVFAAGFGVGFAVPLVAAMAFSLFLGTVVFLTAGIFLLVISGSGNFQWFSLIASPEHSKSFVTFSRPVDASWSPVDLVNSLGDLTYVDTNILSKVLSETMSTMIPFVALVGWGLAMLAGYMIFKRIEKGTVGVKIGARGWACRMIPGLILVTFGIATFLWAGLEFTPLTVVPFIGALAASLIGFSVRGLGEEALPMEYGLETEVSTDIGKKISEMVGFRRTSFEDIGGLDDVKREVKNAILVPLLEPEMASKYGVMPSKGMLLFGPPGCGKTLMLRAVASDLNVDMIGIKCSDVMSKWYGESENLISSLFEEARARAPCILFLDEVDSIAKRRDFYSTDDVTPRVLSIILSEMDGMDAAEGVILVATTNMPDLVDPALMRPGRFDKVIYVPPPDGSSREQILGIHLKGKYAANIDAKEVSRRTKGFSGADIANLVREASSLGLERALETRKPEPITMTDMDEILDEIKPSVTPKMIKMYDKLRGEYERKRRKKGDKDKTRGGPSRAHPDRDPVKDSGRKPIEPEGDEGEEVYEFNMED